MLNHFWIVFVFLYVILDKPFTGSIEIHATESHLANKPEEKTENCCQKVMANVLNEIHNLKHETIPYLLDEKQIFLHQINQLSETVSQLWSRDEYQTQVIDELERSGKETDNEMKLLKQQLSQMQTNQADSAILVLSVAFSAYMTVGVFHPEAGEIFPFNGVRVNLGGCYDSDASIFVCPVDGVYLFSFTIYSYIIRNDDTYRRSTADLTIDNVRVAEVYNNNQDPINWLYLTGSTTVIAECLMGGQVYVTTRYGDGNQVLGSGDQGSPLTLFSGLLLTEYGVQDTHPV